VGGEIQRLREMPGKGPELLGKKRKEIGRGKGNLKLSLDQGSTPFIGRLSEIRIKGDKESI